MTQCDVFISALLALTCQVTRLVQNVFTDWFAFPRLHMEEIYLVLDMRRFIYPEPNINIPHLELEQKPAPAEPKERKTISIINN
jgi:hypothetical protein